MSWNTVGVLAFGFLAAGCAPHVVLQAPPASASEVERREAYESLRPVRTTYEENENYVLDDASTRFNLTALFLANGARVSHADDLLPVLRSDHPAAIAAESYQVRSRRMRRLVASSLTLLVAGVGTVAASFGPRLNVNAVLVGTGMLVTGAVLTLAALVVWALGERDRRNAFALYGRGLDNFFFELSRPLPSG